MLETSNMFRNGTDLSQLFTCA